jgi:hypothetical protein
MWTSRKTFERSSLDSNAEGERGTWTLVLTDNGLVTYNVKYCQRKGIAYSIYIGPDKEKRDEGETRE